jgi:hypothetical protein
MEGQSIVPAPSQEVTGLLRAWSGGDEGALARIVELVYPQLRDIARRCLTESVLVTQFRPRLWFTKLIFG